MIRQISPKSSPLHPSWNYYGHWESWLGFGEESPNSRTFQVSELWKFTQITWHWIETVAGLGALMSFEVMFHPWFRREQSAVYSKLVGGFKHGFYFPFHIWDNPSHWLSYFSRWLKPPSSFDFNPEICWAEEIGGFPWVLPEHRSVCCRQNQLLLISKWLIISISLWLKVIIRICFTRFSMIFTWF